MESYILHFISAAGVRHKDAKGYNYNGYKATEPPVSMDPDDLASVWRLAVAGPGA